MLSHAAVTSVIWSQTAKILCKSKSYHVYRKNRDFILYFALGQTLSESISSNTLLAMEIVVESKCMFICWIFPFLFTWLWIKSLPLQYFYYFCSMSNLIILNWLISRLLSPLLLWILIFNSKHIATSNANMVSKFRILPIYIIRFQKHDITIKLLFLSHEKSWSHLLIYKYDIDAWINAVWDLFSLFFS